MATVKEQRIESLNDYIEANAQLATEIYKDSKASAETRIRGLSIAVRNQVLLNRQQSANRREAVALGMKIQGYNALTFEPGAPDQTPDAVTQ